jgi:hypothetical protein
MGVRRLAIAGAGVLVAVLGLLAAGCSAPAGSVSSSPVPTEATASAPAGSEGTSTPRMSLPTRIGSTLLGGRGAQVRRTFGDGLFTDSDPDGDGRYYVNSDHSATLHISIGTDDRLSVVELTSGVSLPAGRKMTPSAVSPALSASTPAWDGVALGSSHAQVVSQFGPPDRDKTTAGRRIIEYDLGSGDLSVTGRVTFVDGEAQQIGFYAPE